MKNRYVEKGVLWFAALLIVVAFDGSAQNTLSLDVGAARYKINRTIYGGLLEDWGRDIYGGLYVGMNSTIPNTNGMRNDVIAGFKEIGIGVLQFPGGCKAEEYRWTDGIGPKASRPGGDMVNGMGTAEYFQLCSLVNCAPFIQANCRGGSTAMMAAWLKHIDTMYPNRLKYLGIGNEPWGGCYAGISASEYMTKWYDPFSAAIPASFAGKLIRVGSYYTNGAETDTVLRRGIGKMEGLSWHAYATMSWTEGQKTNSTGFSETDYYNILRKAYDMEGGATSTMNQMNTRDPNYTCGFQPDEWGVWLNEMAGMGKSYQQSSVREALIAGQHLNFFNNNCRRTWMAQVAQPVNVIQSLFLTKNPPTAELIKTPTFYAYKLYKPHHDATMIPRTLNCGNVSSQNLKILTASASIDGERRVHISITNIHATAAQSLAITLTGYTFATATGEMVTGPEFNSYNDYGTAERVNVQPLPASNIVVNGPSTLTVTLPKHSVVMLTLTSPNSGVMIREAQEQRRYAIGSLPGKRIVVQHGYTAATPVEFSLFSIDGKLVAPRFKTVLGPENRSFVWQPALTTLGNTTYFVVVSSEGSSVAHRVMLRGER